MAADLGAALRPRPVAESLDELLAGAERRESFVPVDARSPALFERVWLDGVPHVVKHVDPAHDFAMRSNSAGCCVPLLVWESGLMDAVGDIVDHTVVGVARTGERRAAVLMRDVSPHLVPPGDGPIPAEQHAAFLDDLAAVSARMWGWRDDVGLLPYADRWRMFDDALLAGEREAGWPEAVPKLAADLWPLFGERAPSDVAAGVRALLADVTPLADALRVTPSTFLHGDWKCGNLGSAPDGRTILIDWAYCGTGPVCHELAWYLALNRAKLPVGETKEGTIDAFRAALERHGVATADWWDAQLDLCLLGGLVLFGWAAAINDEAELTWWCERARAGLARL